MKKPRLPKGNSDLLALHVAVLDELRNREITRSNNLPTSDYAEYLVARHFGVELQANSYKGFDLRLKERTRVQVKSRRVRKAGTYGNFGVLRGVHDSTFAARQFDVVVAVVFEYDYVLREAWWLPWKVVKKYAAFSKTHKAVRLTRITGAICEEPGVRKLDLLAQIREEPAR
jgi:hypothetical protein